MPRHLSSPTFSRLGSLVYGERALFSSLPSRVTRGHCTVLRGCPAHPGALHPQIRCPGKALALIVLARINGHKNLQAPADGGFTGLPEPGCQESTLEGRRGPQPQNPFPMKARAGDRHISQRPILKPDPKFSRGPSWCSFPSVMGSLCQSRRRRHYRPFLISMYPGLEGPCFSTFHGGEGGGAGGGAGP